jgi:hypothetical protein
MEAPTTERYRICVECGKHCPDADISDRRADPEETPYCICTKCMLPKAKEVE